MLQTQSMFIYTVQIRDINKYTLRQEKNLTVIHPQAQKIIRFELCVKKKNSTKQIL